MLSRTVFQLPYIIIRIIAWQEVSLYNALIQENL